MTWPSEQVLQAIGRYALNECITKGKLVNLTKLDVRQIQNALEKLTEHELLERTEVGCYQLTTYGHVALAEGKPKLRSGPKGEQSGARIRKDSLRARVWRAIRIKKKFCIPDILPLVTNGDEKDAKSNIQHYLSVLEEAGYIFRMKKRMSGTAITSNGYVRWQLDEEKNTGPIAPVCRLSKGCIYDPNIKQEIKLGTEKEVTA